MPKHNARGRSTNKNLLFWRSYMFCIAKIIHHNPIENAQQNFILEIKRTILAFHEVSFYARIDNDQICRLNSVDLRWHTVSAESQSIGVLCLIWSWYLCRQDVCRYVWCTDVHIWQADINAYANYTLYRYPYSVNHTYAITRAAANACLAAMIQ